MRPNNYQKDVRNDSLFIGKLDGSLQNKVINQICCIYLFI